MKNYTITVNGVPYNVTVEENNSGAPVTAPAPSAAPASAPKPSVKEAPVAATGSVSVDAPMPGNILDVKVNVGASVKSGDTLIILEAMKMENNIVAPQDGVIASVNVSKGDSVEAGQALVTLK